MLHLVSELNLADFPEQPETYVPLMLKDLNMLPCYFRSVLQVAGLPGYGDYAKRNSTQGE